MPFWCFKKFLVFLKFSDAAYLPGAKVLLKHEGTMSKSCCLQENFPPLFGKISGNEKFYGQTGGYDDFSVQFLLSQYRFFFRRGTLLRFRRILVSENFMDKRAGGREYHNFPLKLFCLTVHFVEEHLCFGKFPVSKNIMDKSGISRLSVENLLFHSAEKFRGGIIQFFGNMGCEEIYA